MAHERADQPVTEQEAHEALGEYYADITSETKPAQFGKVGYRVVVLDYGLPDANAIRDRRSYYANRQMPASGLASCRS